MYKKIIIANIACMMMIQSLCAQKTDSIRSLLISNKIQNGTELAKMDFAFFDTDAEKIYYQVSLSDTKHLDTSSFLFLEIKKKTNIQYKLRPIYSKKISLSSLKQLSYTDSILFSIAHLSSGNYDIIMNLMNDSSKVLDVKRAGFQLLRNANEKVKEEYYQQEINTKAPVVNIDKTFAGKYDLETIKRNINSLMPIAQGVEVKVIRDLSTTDDILFLKQFFYNFWYNKNASDPESEWKKYAEKLNYVAKEYGNGTMAGYQTDRGRIYMVYGEPTKIERVPSERDALPYEIWFYKFIDTKTNVSFLFYQPGRISADMFLLHSNYDPEIQNPYWKEVILLDPNNSENKYTHRVFEYFK